MYESEHMKWKEFDDELENTHGDSISIPEVPYEEYNYLNLFHLKEDPNEDTIDIPEDGLVKSTGEDVHENTFIDVLIYKGLLIPQGEGLKSEKVKVMLKDTDGKHIGTFDKIHSIIEFFMTIF